MGVCVHVVLSFALGERLYNYLAPPFTALLESFLSVFSNFFHKNRTAGCHGKYWRCTISSSNAIGHRVDAATLALHVNDRFSIGLVNNYPLSLHGFF